MEQQQQGDYQHPAAAPWQTAHALLLLLLLLVWTQGSRAQPHTWGPTCTYTPQQQQQQGVGAWG
jgi:hypothetical protein